MSLYQERPYPTQVFIFRITAAQPTNTANTTAKSMYPLCGSGWCLARLRTACSLWAFVRAALVERVWDEPVPEVIHAPVPKRAVSRDSTVSSLVASVLPGGADKQAEKASPGAKPPLPARKSKIGGFWGRASNVISASVAQVSQVSRSATTGSTEEKQLPSTPPRMARANSTPGHAASPSLQVNGSSLVLPVLPQRSENRKSRAVTPVPPAEHSSAPPTELGPPIVLNDTSSGVASTPAVESPAFLTPSQDLPTDPMQAFVVPEPSDGSAVSPTPHGLPLPGSPAILPTTPAMPDTMVPTASAVVILPTPDAVTPPRSTVKADAHTTPDASVISTSALESNAPVALSPSRNASPAPGTVPALPTRSTARTASPAPASPGGVPGTPPPIPRRAAARAPRPISLVAQAVSNATATAEVSSPLAATHPQSVGTDAEKLPESLQNATASVPEEATPPSTVESGTQPPQRTETPPSPTPVRETAVATAVLEPPPPTQDGPPIEVAPTITPVGISDDHSESTHVEAPSAPEANVEVIETLTTPVTEPDAIALITTTSTAQPEVQPKNEEDSEVYVGDATWEERAWKELARLREDMFWARVGGVR